MFKSSLKKRFFSGFLALVVAIALFPAFLPGTALNASAASIPYAENTYILPQDNSNWSASANDVYFDTPESNKISVQRTGFVYYNESSLRDKLAKFSFQLHEASNMTGSWMGFVLRPSDPTKGTFEQQSGYLIIITANQISMAKIGAGFSLTYLGAPVENTVLTDHQIHTVRIGTIEEGTGVRIVFEIDGNIAIDYLDGDNPVTNDTSFMQSNCGEVFTILSFPEGANKQLLFRDNFNVSATNYDVNNENDKGRKAGGKLGPLFYTEDPQTGAGLYGYLTQVRNDSDAPGVLFLAPFSGYKRLAVSVEHNFKWMSSASYEVDVNPMFSGSKPGNNWAGLTFASQPKQSSNEAFPGSGISFVISRTLDAEDQGEYRIYNNDAVLKSGIDFTHHTGMYHLKISVSGDNNLSFYIDNNKVYSCVLTEDAVLNNYVSLQAYGDGDMYQFAVFDNLSVSGTPAPPEPPVFMNRDITIYTNRTNTLNGSFKGFGVQEDANFLWTAQNQAYGSIVPDDYDNYIRPALRNMKLPWVRKFIDLGWFARNEGEYTWDSPAMQGLYTDLEELKNNGTDVMLTIWMIPSWLTAVAPGTDSEGFTAGQFPSPGTSPDYADKWATVVTDLMKHLYGTDGSGYQFANIKYLGAPNELGFTNYSGLTRPYTLLDSKLKDAGVRSNVALFGPDFYGLTDINPVRNDPVLNPLLGFYDIHIYPQRPEDTLAMIDVAAMQAAGSSKQVWITEIGDPVKGNVGFAWTGLPVFAIDSVNHGAAGISLWDIVDQAYMPGPILDNGKCGILDSVQAHYKPKPSYYAWSVVTSHTAPDSLVYSNTCDDRSYADLRVTALNDQKGHNTIMAYNMDDQASQVLSFKYEGSAPVETLYRYLINPSSLPSFEINGYSLGYDKIIQMVDGEFTDTVPPGSFAVYSSLNPTGPLPVPEPAELTAAAGNNQVTLSWASAQGAASYRIGRSTSQGGPYETVATGVATTVFIDRVALQNDTPYYYVVSSENSSGTGGNSNEASVTPSSALPASGAVIPSTASFDKNPSAGQTGVSAEIAWNDAAKIIGIKQGARILAESAYSVSGNILAISRDYLSLQPEGSIPLTVLFDKGAAAVLNISIIDSAVPIPAMMSVLPAYLTLNTGESQKGITALFDGSGNKISDFDISWSSDNPDIASVDEDGTISGKSFGDTVIRAVYGNLDSNVQVKVRQNSFARSYWTFAGRTIAIDGSIDNLDGIKSINLQKDGSIATTKYRGSEDLSGNMWITWDDSNLYLTAKIHDETFVNNYSDANIWQGDCIQLGFAPATGSDRYELGIASTPGGPQAYLWTTMPGGMQPGLITNAHLAVNRDEQNKDTVYELALPWADINPIKPDGSLYKMSALVCDNDGNGWKGGIEWGSGIVYHKNTDMYKNIKFVPSILSSAELIAGSDRLVVGEHTGISLTAAMSDGSPVDFRNATVNYINSDPTVIKISNGRITAKKAGSATIISEVILDDVLVESNAVTINVEQIELQRFDELLASGKQDGDIKNDGNYHSLLATVELIQKYKDDPVKVLIGLNALGHKTKAFAGKFINEDFAGLLLYDINYLEESYGGRDLVKLELLDKEKAFLQDLKKIFNEQDINKLIEVE